MWWLTTVAAADYRERLEMKRPTVSRILYILCCAVNVVFLRLYISSTYIRESTIYRGDELTKISSVMVCVYVCIIPGPAGDA